MRDAAPQARTSPTPRSDASETDTSRAAPFRWDGDTRGLLLVHGFTGSPFEMRLLGASLAERGYTVVGPRLAGHTPKKRELKSTTWPDWYGSVAAAFDELRGRCSRVGVIGLSLGGLLTLELARRRGAEVAAIGVLSAPVFLPPHQVSGVRFLCRSRLFRGLSIPTIGGSDINDRAMKKQNPSLDGGMPVSALGSLIDLGDHLRPLLGEIDRPMFLAHARRDGVAPFACSELIATSVRGPVERMILERSNHVITLDLEREELYARVGDFFDRAMAPATALATDDELAADRR